VVSSDSRVVDAPRVPEMLALRGTSIVFTVFTALGVAAFAKRLVGEQAALWAAGVYLFNPFTLVWGRAILIESFTTAAVMGWLLSAARVERLPTSTHQRRPFEVWSLCTIFCGVVACTSKFTTALPWALVVVLLLRPRIRNLLRVALLVGIPLIAGIGWTAWTDHLKAANIFTENLTSKAFRDGVMMSMSDRFKLSIWTTIGSRSFLFLGGIGVVWLVLGVVALIQRKHLMFCASLLSVPVFACTIFLGLYNVHDYYQSAFTPALAIVGGIGAAEMHRLWKTKTPLLVGGAFMHLFGFVVGGAFSLVHSQMPAESAPELAQTTRANEQVLGNGLGWDPQPFFEADRHGLMLTGNPDLDIVVRHLESDLGSPRVLWVSRPQPSKIAREFLGKFALIAAVGKQTYRFGNEADLRNGPTSPLSIWRSGVFSKRMEGNLPQIIPCDGARHSLDTPTHWLFLKVASGVSPPAANTWITTSDLAAPMPARNGTLQSVSVISEMTCRSIDAEVADVKVWPIQG
jgi:hypothetical protein